jgi:hypothetical protein
LITIPSDREPQVSLSPSSPRPPRPDISHSSADSGLRRPDDEVEIDDADCLPDSDKTTPYIDAVDNFGRRRRVRRDSESTKRISAGDSKPGMNPNQTRSLASYEDI